MTMTIAITIICYYYQLEVSLALLHRNKVPGIWGLGNTSENIYQSSRLKIKTFLRKTVTNNKWMYHVHGLKSMLNYLFFPKFMSKQNINSNSKLYWAFWKEFEKLILEYIGKIKRMQNSQNNFAKEKQSCRDHNSIFRVILII